MKVIFLDIDGVLNCDKCNVFVEKHGCYGIVNQNLSRLKQIVDETGARIVLCSSWRTFWSQDDELCIVDATSHIMNNRGEEIRTWLDNHPLVTDWIVLDDEIFYGL